ncbi:MAG: hypothetical protein IKS20_00595, partial [Victivallales bacterium]|nr:hypothetical protein [Victivallales bacterium]
MKFYTIMPFRAKNPDFMAEEYIRFHKETGLSLLMPSMTMNPEGDTPYEKLHLFIEAFGKLKEKLQGTGIELGILVQSLIGHGWTSACPTGIFQTTVNHLNKPRGRICPLDPGFLEYCRFAISNLAKFKPALFMLDDDTRLLDNDKLECFCPLHRAKFSKHYSQEELIELVLSAKPGDPILMEFESVRRNSLRDFCRNIRAAIDAVDPSIRCGVSGPGREQNMFGEMARAAAGPNTRPFVRVGNAMYFEGSAKALPRRVYQTQVQKMGCLGVEDILDESDTYPHDLYSKSVSGMHSHICAALVNGLNGAKLWIENFINAEAGRPNTAFERYFKEYAGFYG